jgi:hypothetical protein
MAQSSLPANIQAHIQGDISGQVAIGNNIIQIGSVHGGVVNIVAPEQQPRPRPRPSPVFLRPQPVPELLDREAELGGAVSALESDLPVEFSGEEGVGKTTLVRHMAYHSSADRFPDGVVYHFVRHKPVPDMLQSLFDAFYESDVPLKPTDAEIRHSLENKKALILLDDVELPRAEVESLMDAVPRCTFVLASEKRRLWREGHPVALQGLPLDDGLALVERELGRPLAQEERTGAEDLCTALEGHPLRILQAVALAQEEGRSLAEMAQRMQAPDASDVLITGNLASLSESEQRVLAALAALAGAPLDADHLASLAGLVDAAPILQKLHSRGLVEAHSPRYSLAGGLDEDLGQRWNLGPWRERALTHFTTWTEDHRSEPDALLEEAEAILELLRWGIDARRWAEVLRLGQAVEGALTLSGQWGGWAQVLEWVLQAAEALGNQGAEAWALHQVGTRAFCLGEADAARNFLTQALELREALGDRIGAAITRHNLDLLLGPPPPPEGPPEPPPEAPPDGLSLPIIALVSVVLVAVVGVVIVIGGGFLICSIFPCPPPFGPGQVAVDIWLEDGCDREYSYRFQTGLSVSASAEGIAEIGLDEESFEETWLIPEERWTTPWTFEDLEPGWHEFWVELRDESGTFLARDDCSFALVEGPREGATEAPSDTTGPSIDWRGQSTYDVCSDGCCGDAPMFIEITAIVSDPSGVSSVELYCTIYDGEGEIIESEHYCGDFVGRGDSWTIKYIPSPDLTYHTIDYRIKATDDSPGRNMSWWGSESFFVGHWLC